MSTFPNDRQHPTPSRSKVLVIGYGSIGSRHCRLLHDTGHDLAVVSSRTDVPFATFHDTRDALATFDPDVVIVANPTASHKQALEILHEEKFRGTALVEKPLFDKVCDIVPNHPVFVAYNLRFHPLIQKIKTIVAGQNVYSAQFYVGQYLPLWRPGTDYRTSYSASASQGGGVLRDLSHELDLAAWLLGTWKRVTAVGGKVSDLEIDSDDLFCLLLETANCPAVSIQVNYLDLKPRRELIINLRNISLRADLVSGTLAVNDAVETCTVSRDHTYQAQLKALLANDTETLCTHAEGLDVMTLVDAAQQAAAERIWIQKN